MKCTGLETLSREDIDSRSQRLLIYFHPHYFEKVKPTPLTQISEFLHNRHGISFHFDTHLGYNHSGVKILGACQLSQKKIVTDNSIRELETKFNFTLAHELGHLALHRKVKITEDAASQGIEDTALDMVSGKRKLTSDKDWLEWQANAYAASLLMPRKFVELVLLAVQEKLGISTNRGMIYLDDQSCNKMDFFQILREMAAYFKVSSSAIEYRLSHLGLLNDHRRHPVHVSEVMIELL
jgi:Zn-dependent peptidase ImmA (M78 family)